MSKKKILGRFYNNYTTFDQILGSPTILIAMENTFSLFLNDQSASQNHVQHFGSGTLPAGAELRSVTFFVRGFNAGDTVLGVYSGTQASSVLIQNLGIQSFVNDGGSGNQSVTWTLNPPVAIPNLRLGYATMCTENVGCTLVAWQGALNGTTVIDTGNVFPSLPNPMLFEGGFGSQEFTHEISYSFPVNATDSELELSKDKAFNLAQSTALTVLGIFPIILFFSLFAIFSAIRSS